LPKLRNILLAYKLNSRLLQYLLVVIVIGLTIILCLPLSSSQNYHIVSFLLLFVVAVLAVFMGIGPVLVASTLSAVAWNFFFIPPFHTFHIGKTEDKLMFGSFFIIAILNGILTNRLRRQEIIVRERENQTNALFRLTRELSKVSGTEKVLEVAAIDFKRHFQSTPLFFIPDNNNGLKCQSFRDETITEKPDNEIIEWVIANSSRAGRYTSNFSDAVMTYYPLTATRMKTGVIAFSISSGTYGRKEAFWSTYFSQISNALEREYLGKLALEARVLSESDKLYKTLFNLISHEFRIPIATIMGATDTLLMSNTSDQNREDLFSEIFHASARLNHLVENLLNMSRLESGKISLRQNWHDINDLINKAINNLKEELSHFKVTVNIPDELPLVRIDFGLMEQVMNNLLLNACQNSPAGSEIKIGADYGDGNLILKIGDEGTGFHSEMIPKLFNKFFRGEDSKPGGLGLGLSIVKGIVESHGGIVDAEIREKKGAVIVIRIPSEKPDIDSQKLIL